MIITKIIGIIIICINGFIIYNEVKKTLRYKKDKLRYYIKPIKEVKRIVNMDDSIDPYIVEMLVIDSQMPVKEWREVIRRYVADIKGELQMVNDKSTYYIEYHPEVFAISDGKNHYVHEYSEVPNLPRKVTYDCKNPFALAEIIVKCSANEEVKARLLHIKYGGGGYVVDVAKGYIYDAKNTNSFPHYLFKVGDKEHDIFVDEDIEPLYNDSQIKLLAAQEAMKKAGII